MLSELNMLERQYTKRLAHLKAQKKEREFRRLIESELDAKQSDANVKTVTTTVPKVSSTKQPTTTSSAVTKPRTTKPPASSGQQFTVVFHTAGFEKEKKNKEEKSKIESKVLSILSKALRDYDHKFEGIRRHSTIREEPSSTLAPAVEPTTNGIAESTASYPTSVERVAEVALRKALQEKEQDDEPQLNAPRKLYSLTSSSVESTKDSPPSIREPEVFPAAASSKHSKSGAAMIGVGSGEDAVEVNEMLSLIEADEKAERAEAGSDSNEIRRLREETRAKVMAFLQRRVEKLTAELDRAKASSTTTSSASTSTTAATTTVPPSTSSTTKTSTTASTITTTAPTTTTKASSTTTKKENDGSEETAFKQIPEAEEEGITWCSSSNIEPNKLASVISPIAGIIDNIGPIIAPLLRARAAAAAKIFWYTRKQKTQ
ncbi:hypothetical protein COOONC_11104 [Cooperia oncophora]